MAAVAPQVDAILEGLQLLCDPENVYELRILKTRKKTVSGYFNDLDRMAAAARQWSGKAPGVYFTINPVKPELLARASNHLVEYADQTTSDADILRRRWIPLDFDPVRPAGISSSDAQHEAAIHRARDAARWLVSQQIDREMLILADSGNGGHLLIEVNEPNNDCTTEMVRNVVHAISIQFSDELVSVDTTSVNAARIWKVYGTLAAKGDNLPDRPHRESRLLKAHGR